MSSLNDLYQQLIIDHGRSPRNFGKLSQANHIKEGFNPLCGDKITIYLLVENDYIKEASFEGQGCAISIASASLMTQNLIGKSIVQTEEIFNQFQYMVTHHDEPINTVALGKLSALSGVAQYPMRVKCATLPWHTTMAALRNNPNLITTE